MDSKLVQDGKNREKLSTLWFKKKIPMTKIRQWNFLQTNLRTHDLRNYRSSKKHILAWVVFLFNDKFKIVNFFLFVK